VTAPSKRQRAPGYRGIARGWEGVDKLNQQFRSERDEVLADVSIEELSVALGVQVHDSGLTCPIPDHHQRGRDAPASVFVSDEGIERWWCHSCHEGGTAIDFVLLAGFAENYHEALDVLRDQEPSRAPRERTATRPPEDPNRRRPVRAGWRECERWANGRGWKPAVLSQQLGADRWGFVWDTASGEFFMRVFTDDDRVSWQDRAIPGEDGARWRSAAGRRQLLYVWEPPAAEQDHAQRLLADKRQGAAWGPLWNPPRPLVVEGASDFLTAVVAQHVVGPWRSPFTVVGLPGAGRTALMTQRDDWVVLLDNDDAGRAARKRIDTEQAARVRHLYVPAPHNDLNDWWCATRPRDRRRWIDDLIEQKDRP
jgi:hypothetical protein